MSKFSPDIFENALLKLKQGASLQEVFLAFPEYEQELKELLPTAQIFMAMPKKPVPEPIMQRKFISVPAKNLWFAWLNLSKFASISVSAILLITALAGTGYAASQAVPGQALFSIKKITERVRLNLTTNPVQKANLQMAITQDRLSDAKQVFGNPQHDPSQELAALNELSAETKKTIDAVNSATKVAQSAQNNHPIVASLSDLSKQQQELLKEIKPDQNNSSITSNILAQLKDNESEVQKMVAASNGDEALTNLNQASSTPDGQKTGMNKTTTTPLETVKGGAINTSSSTPKSESSTSTTGSAKKPVMDTQETPSAPDPNTAVGSFILEDPQPQSAF
jgi:hypothetical protein